MISQRWLRIIPVALIMYTISYVDRTNVSLALDQNISTLMRDLAMDDRMKGQAAGIFFLGYVLLQMAGGHLAGKWSAKKLVSLCLIFWGVCAVGCGLAKTFTNLKSCAFCWARRKAACFPPRWCCWPTGFPARNARGPARLWNLCQPLAVVASAPVTGWLLGAYGWQTMLILEGALPFLWLPVWWFFISDHPREAKWISAEGKELFGDHAGDARRRRLKPPPHSLLAPAGAARNPGDDRHEFLSQRGGLRLHDIFHGQLEGETF